MPYYGRNRFAFGANQPIVLVYGENMWGKSSLFNAVRWAWYGVARDRYGVPIRLFNLINWDAADEQHFVTAVRLEFEVDGDPYVLNRRIEPRRDIAVPNRDADFEELLFLERNQRTLRGTDAQASLNSLLDSNIADFFFFDGEQLDEYEQLLMDNRSQAATLRDSIEKVLGVPALRNAIQDLKQGQKDALRRQRRLAERSKPARAAAGLAERTVRLIEAKTGDIGRLDERRRSTAKDISELDEQLRQTESAEAQIASLDQIGDEIDRLNGDIGKRKDTLRDYLSSAWLDLINSRVVDERNKLTRERDHLLEQVQEAATIRARVKELDTLTSEGICPVCGHRHDQADSTKAQLRRSQLVDQLERLDSPDHRLSEVSGTLDRLDRIAPAGVARSIAQLETDIRKDTVRLVDYEGRRDDLREALKDHDETAIVENRLRWEELTKRLGIIERDIGEQEQSVRDLERDLQKYQSQIGASDDPTLKRLNQEVALYDELIALFETALGTLRDRLKDDVQSTASEVFLELTTEPAYQGLKINDNYGLTIVRTGGRQVPIRSAGAEQIVALSLISALNRHAVQTAPVIMDTPFGRLDRGHRANFLAFAPRMAEQLVLLVHGGELDRERDLRPINGYIDHEYRIDRISEARSQFVAEGQ